MVKTTFVWVSFSEENQKLLTYQMFRGFPQAQNMVTFYLLMICFIFTDCFESILSGEFWSIVSKNVECNETITLNA